MFNIPGNQLSKGDVWWTYVGSGPPKDTGLHRYVFLSELYMYPCIYLYCTACCVLYINDITFIPCPLTSSHPHIIPHPSYCHPPLTSPFPFAHCDTVYKQPAGRVTPTEPQLGNTGKGRNNTKAKDVAANYNLGNPVAGNFYQAQWDDYVPILYSKLH